MKSRFVYALPAFLLAILVAVISFGPDIIPSVQAAKPIPLDTTQKGAQIKVDEDVYDFHDIEQGTIAEHKFAIHNIGTDTLVIMSTHPSCGCTAAIMDNQRIAPGGTSMMQVKFDANNKPEGPIIKTVTITSNSAKGADKIVRIQGRVVKSKLAHKTAMHLDGIFQGNCATCHVDKGKGELGARLFEADCAVCHGLKADGKPGPELASDAMMNHTPKQWKQIIEDGLPNSAMPAFATKNKGPLGADEIASLLEYMGAFKKELLRSKNMKSLSPTTSKTSMNITPSH